MNTYDIPYSKEMILAKLAGNKTQTRRPINPQPHPDFLKRGLDAAVSQYPHQQGVRFFMADGLSELIRAPYGGDGDRQYWKEAFDFGGITSDKKAIIRYKADQLMIIKHLNYEDYCKCAVWQQPSRNLWRGMPAMFMLRSMSRGMDEVTGLEVERLQDIMEEDARAEGITDGGCLSCGEPEPCRCANPMPCARDAYVHLWDSIYAKKFPWQSNPWVWKYMTKRVS